MNLFRQEHANRSSEEDDTNLAHLPRTQYIVEPNSTISSFSLQIIIPLVGPPSSRGKRGVSPIQPGGRLLLYDTVPLDKDRLQVMLTLHPDRGGEHYRVIGQLTGKSVPPVIKALLRVGNHSYEIEACEGRLEIESIEFGDIVQELAFSLMTMDRVE